MKRFFLAALAVLSFAVTISAMGQGTYDATRRQQTGAYGGGN